MCELIERIEKDDPYIIPHLMGWAGEAEPQPWGSATPFAMGTAYRYGLIANQTNTTLTEKGRAVVEALRAREASDA